MPDGVRKTMAKTMLKDFEEHWGGDNWLIFNPSGKTSRAEGGRQKGIHPALIIATFLDPRFRHLTWLKKFRCLMSIKG
jgi:hypothetical protein